MREKAHGKSSTRSKRDSLERAWRDRHGQAEGKGASRVPHRNGRSVARQTLVVLSSARRDPRTKGLHPRTAHRPQQRMERTHGYWSGSRSCCEFDDQGFVRGSSLDCRYRDSTSGRRLSRRAGPGGGTLAQTSPRGRMK